jgi:hypothetical protein
MSLAVAKEFSLDAAQLFLPNKNRNQVSSRISISFAAFEARFSGLAN